MQELDGLKLEITQEYDLLTRFFEKNGLEISEDEPVPTDTLKCWKISDGDTLVAAAALALREGRYILDGIAVEEPYRKLRLGKMLLDLVIEEVKLRKGDALYLVARAPVFFRKSGFEAVAAAAAPQFFECFTCPQYKVTCHPEIMKLNI